MINKNNYKRIIIKKNTNSSSRSTVGSNIQQKNTFSIVDLNKEDKNNEDKDISIINIMNNIYIKKVKSQSNIFDKNKLIFQEYAQKKVNPISKEYYKNMNINQAPTLYINKKSICRIINKKKKEKINSYNHFYFKTKLNSHKGSRNINNHSNFYCEDKTYLINTKNNNNSNITELHYKSTNDNLYLQSSLKNNSLINKSLNSSRTEKEEDEKMDIFPNIIRNLKKKNNLNNLEENKSKLKNSQDNQNFINNSVMMTLLPNVNKIKRNHSQLEIKNNDINLSNFETKKLEAYIYDLIYKKHIYPSELVSLEGHITKIKYFQKIQEINYEKLLKTDKYNVNNKINYLEKIFKIFNNVWEKYRKKMVGYLIFLNKVVDNMQTELENSLIYKKEIQIQIEKLMILNVKKQCELEELVKIRNFLLQVKLKFRRQPEYFKPLLHRDSKKIEVGNCILNSMVGTKNSDVLNFLDSFSLLNLVQVYEVNPSDSTKLLLIKRKKKKRKTKNMNLYNFLPKLFKEKYIYKKNLLEDEKIYLPLKKEQFFNSPLEFKEIMENLEQKNLLLLNRIIELKRSYEVYKQEYDNICSQKYDDEEKDLEIKDKIRYLTEIKRRNKFLEVDCNSLKNIQFNIENKYTVKFIKNKENSTFVDINYFKTRNYFNEIKKQKFQGVMLFETLKKFILDFFSCKSDYDIKRSYEIVDGYLPFKKLFALDKNSFCEDNKFMINNYILKLLQIYNDIYQFVYNKHILYELDEKNKQFIKCKKEEIQTMRKIENSRVIRELLEEKRQNNIRKILEKANNPTKRIKTRVDERTNFKLFRHLGKKNIKEKIGSKENNNENEFYELTFY